MALSRRYKDSFKFGLKGIKNFICFPWAWACGEYDKKDSCFDPSAKANRNLSDAAAATAIGVSIAVEAPCAIAKCCCRSPIACLCSAVTVPVGSTAAVIYGLGGAIGLGAVKAYECAVPVAPARQEMPEHKPVTSANSSGFQQEQEDVRPRACQV